MGPKRVAVELYGEYDRENGQLTGIWVSFLGSWRPPFLWRDIGALAQTLNAYRKDCPEFTEEGLVLLEPGETIICHDFSQYEVLNVLGSPLHWYGDQRPICTEEPAAEMTEQPGSGRTDRSTGGTPDAGRKPPEPERDSESPRWLVGAQGSEP